MKMLTKIHPKLPMRNKAITKAYYTQQLRFDDVSAQDYEGYLIIKRDQVEIHFFEFKELDTLKNYSGTYIRTSEIENFYQELIKKGVPIHPNAPLTSKPWGQKEFALLDPDHNLITFGQAL